MSHSVTLDNPSDCRDVFLQCLANTRRAAAIGEEIVDDDEKESSIRLLFCSDAERETCQKLVESLDPEFQVHAAHTSYAYWYLSTQGSSSVQVTPEDRLYAAMREARRHYVAAGRDFEKARKTLTETCQYRKDHKIDLLRTCFDATREYDYSPEDKARAQEMAALIRLDMDKQCHILRGQDQHGQAIMIKYPRTQPGTIEAAYVMAQIFMAERSTACTEFLTYATKERSMAVYNYIGFDKSASPGFAMQAAAATLLQKLYPERLQTLVFVEPPFWLKGILAVLTPFLSDSITERIQWATGDEERDVVFAKLLGSDNLQNASPLMRKKGQLTSPVSLEHFLVDTPFYGTYDSVPCTREYTADELLLDKIAHNTTATPPGPDPGPSLSEKASSLWDSFSNSFTGSFSSGGDYDNNRNN